MISHRIFNKTLTQSVIKLEFQNNNFHIKTKANTNTTRNTMMNKQNLLLRKNTQKTSSILDISLKNK